MRNIITNIIGSTIIVSLIIMAGIIARVPTFLVQVFEQARTGAINPAVIIGFLALFTGIIAFVVFIERAQRRLAPEHPNPDPANGGHRGGRCGAPDECRARWRHDPCRRGCRRERAAPGR